MNWPQDMSFQLSLSLNHNCKSIKVVNTHFQEILKGSGLYCLCLNTYCMSSLLSGKLQTDTAPYLAPIVNGLEGGEPAHWLMTWSVKAFSLDPLSASASQFCNLWPYTGLGIQHTLAFSMCKSQAHTSTARVWKPLSHRLFKHFSWSHHASPGHLASSSADITEVLALKASCNLWCA